MLPNWGRMGPGRVVWRACRVTLPGVIVASLLATVSAGSEAQARAPQEIYARVDYAKAPVRRTTRMGWERRASVPYTHLTLPTILRVYISSLAVVAIQRTHKLVLVSLCNSLQLIFCRSYEQVVDD